jgi:hypothetical protein
MKKKWKRTLKTFLFVCLTAYIGYVCAEHSVFSHSPRGGGETESVPQPTPPLRGGVGWERTSFYSLIKNRTNISVPWKNQDFRMVMTSLDALLRSTTAFDVLCMHHLDITDTYRACSLINRRSNQVYFMLDPQIIGKSQETQTVVEHSICYKQTQTRIRAKDVMVQWKRADYSTMYAMFESVSIQLAIDEFECSNSQPQGGFLLAANHPPRSGV